MPPTAKIQAPAKRNLRYIIPALPLIVITSFRLPATVAAEAVGAFTQVEGAVDVLREGVLPAIPVKVNDPVRVKDVIRTKSNARTTIAFNDGNTLKLAERSRMGISEYLSDATTLKGVIDLPRGKVQAAVERENNRITTPRKGNKFEIRTPNAVAGVRGTDYIVSHGRNMTMVLANNGVVAVHNPQTPGAGTTVLTAGNATTVPQGRPPQPPRPVKSGEMEKLEKDTAPAAKPQSQGAAPPSEAPPADAGGMRVLMDTLPVEHRTASRGSGSMNGSTIQLQGAGAGAFGAGTFAGTAAPANLAR